jgi:N-acetylneuraminate synthase/N,N'-diacetyllegionaminate synthase
MLAMLFAKAYLVAEIGINHNGDVNLAEEMIHAAAQAGADAVKFQNYRTEDFLSDRSLEYTYLSQGREVNEPQFDMFKRCELSRADLGRLKKACDSAGVEFFSTPTGVDGIKELSEIGATWIKNGSDYLGHLPLIREMARSGIPTILSTGMALEEEITEAVEAFREAGGGDLVLLACTSAYPAPSDSLHLRRITTLAKMYGCPAGFSDHSAGWEAAVASVCVGACMVEKHFTTDRHLPGPDQWFSSTPEEFAELVRRVRGAEEMLGCGDLRPTRAEAQARENFRLSCTAARDLTAGSILKVEDISFLRPATGLPPSKLESLIGHCLVADIQKGEAFQPSHIEIQP